MRDDLLESTTFTGPELDTMWRAYGRASRDRADGLLDRREFLVMLESVDGPPAQVGEKTIHELLWPLLDDGTGHCDFADVPRQLALLRCRLPRPPPEPAPDEVSADDAPGGGADPAAAERAAWALQRRSSDMPAVVGARRADALFRLYDVDGDGRVGGADLAAMLRGALGASGMELPDAYVDAFVLSTLARLGTLPQRGLTLDQFRAAFASAEAGTG